MREDQILSLKSKSMWLQEARQMNPVEAQCPAPSVASLLDGREGVCCRVVLSLWLATECFF